MEGFEGPSDVCSDAEGDEAMAKNLLSVVRERYVITGKEPRSRDCSRNTWLAVIYCVIIVPDLT